MRAIFAGGGTGGHFYPAFSIARELIKRKHKIVFAVRENDISLPTLIKEDIPFVEIDMIAFPRAINPIKHFVFILKLIKSILYARRIIIDFQPDFIFLTGSYISFAFIIPAFYKKIPIYIHESNAIYGLSNYISAIFADKIFLGLPIKNNRFKEKSIITGTPIREIFFKDIDTKSIKDKFKIPHSNTIITCFGGSQGARNINNAIYYYILENNTNNIKNITIIHITGKKNYEEVRKRYEESKLLNENLILLDYYENMNEIYLISNLIISRSGASTIAELIYTKKPALLIPLPSAASNHQYENARFLFEHGCAIIIKDDEKLSINLIKNINFLLQKERLKTMEKSYQRIELPKGSDVIKKITENILK